MPAENERLGIELEIIAPKGGSTEAFLKELQASLTKITEALQKIDLTKLGKDVKASTASASKDVDAFASNVKKLNTELTKVAVASFKIDGLEVAAKAVAGVSGVVTKLAVDVRQGNESWKHYVDRNKEAAKALTDDWHKAQKLMSDGFNGKVSTSTSTGLSEAVKQEENNNKVRAEIKRIQAQDDDKYLAKQLENHKKQEAELRRFNAAIDKEDADAAAKAKARMERLQTIQAQRDYQGYTPVNGGYVKSSVNASVSYQPNQSGSFSPALSELQAEAKLLNIVKVQDAERKQQEEHGKAIVAILKNTRAVAKAEHDKAVAEWQQYLAALNNANQKYYNGAVIPKGYVTNVSDAHTQAVAQNSARDLSKVDQVLASLKAKSSDVKITAAMATEEFKKLGINIAGLDPTALNKVNAGLHTLKLSASQATGAISNTQKDVTMWSKLFGESLGKMATRLTEFYSLRTAILAVGSQLRDAISGAVDFNQNIHDIAAIAGSSREEMGALGTSILDIAKNSRFSANEVSGLMQVLAQAGIKARDLGEVSSVVGKFATATASKPEVAADVFTTTLTVFKKEASESTTIANALTAALNNSKLTTEGLATAFNYLAPQAAQFGMTMEQTLGVVAGMSQAGVKASTIGTGTSQLLKELAVPKERLKNLLDYYAIKTEEVNPKLRTFAEIVETLNSAVGRSGEKGVQAEHLFAALESRVGRSVVTAVTLGADTFTNMTNSITGTNAATVAFEKTMEGPRAKINVLKQEVLSLAVSIGSTLGPALAGMTDFITSAVRGLSTTPGLFTSTAVGIGAVTVAVRALTLAAMANPIIAGVTAGVLAITAAMAYFGRETDETVISAREQHKAYVEMAESTQRVKDVTSAAIVEAERKNRSLSAYTELLKGNKKQVEEANALGNTRIYLNAETKKSLHGLKDAHKDWFDNINLESLKLSDLYALLQKVNAERMKGTHASVASYNELQAKINEIEPALTKDKAESVAYNKPGGARRLPEEASDVWKYMWYNPNSMAKREKKLSKFTAERDKLAADTDAQVLHENYKKDSTTNMWVLKTQQDKDNDAKALAEIEKKRSVSRIPKAGGSSTSSQEKTYGANIIKELQEKSKELQAEAKLQEEIFKDADKSYEDRADAYNEAAVALSKSLTLDTNAEVIKLTSEYAAKNKIKGYNPEAQLAALESGQTYAMEAGNEESFKQFRTTVNELVDRKTKEYQVAAAKQYKEMSAVDKKTLDAFNADAAKHEEDAFARKAAKLKQAVQFAFKQPGSNADLSKGALGAYLKADGEKIDKKYDGEVNDATKRFSSWGTAQQKEMRPKYEADLKNINDTRNAEKEKSQATIVGEALSGVDSGTAKAEKELDLNLGKEQSRIALAKELATTIEQVKKLEIEGTEASINAARTRDSLNTTALGKVNDLMVAVAEYSKLTVEQFKEQGEKGELSQEMQALYDVLITRAEVYRGKVANTTNELKLQAVQLARQKDTSFFGNFMRGSEDAFKKLSDFQAITQELGSSLTNTAINGVASSLSSSFTTMFNPDQSKINELNTQIASLRSQKITLESDIKTIEANTSKTPEEIKSLNDKKVALDNVNNSLAQQEAAVRKQKDAWATFAEGLKGIMKTILQELQNYIAKLLVVWAVEQMVNGIKSMFGGGQSGTPMTDLQFAQARADGGLIQKFDSGGLALAGGAIPNNVGTPGKDSVPAMLMPGEVVIKKSSVDYYGADKLLALNEGKIAKFADGGFVGGRPNSSSTSNEVNDKDIHLHLNVTNIADPRSVPTPSASDIVNVVAFNANSKKELYQVIKNVVAS